MKHFIFRLICFSIPVVVVLVAMFSFLRLTGENFLAIENIVESNSKYLMGFAYNSGNDPFLKWKDITTNRKRKIWAVGSSRVLQFRENMFESSFYNAGYAVYSIGDFLPFLESIPNSKHAEVLIIGLDQMMFNENWDNLRNPRSKSFWENSFSYYPAPNTLVSTTSDLLQGKYDLSIMLKTYDTVNNIQKIGLNALVNCKGFRNDGSYSYGHLIEQLLVGDSTIKDYKYSDTYCRIKKGHQRFEYGNDANSEAFHKLDLFLSFCSENEIQIVGFLPPFPKEINSKMIATENYDYLKKIYPQALPYFKKYNFELWDLTNAEKYNSSDNEFIDGLHGGEMTYLKMLIYMVMNNSILGSHTDLIKLEKDLENKKNRYSVYEY